MLGIVDRQVLTNEVACAVVLGRQLLADPDWVIKVKKGLDGAKADTPSATLYPYESELY